MAQLIGRNIVKFILLMIAISIVTFVLVGISPIDPVQANVGQTAYASMSDEQRAQLASYWGANTPLWERYLNWLGALLRGDMGTSLRFNAPVTEVLANRSLNTLALMAVAWILSGIIGLLMGIVAGIKQGTLIHRIIKGYCFVLASTPTFWLGLIVLMIFAVWLGWFPIGFSAPIGKSAADITIFDSIHHMILPALMLRSIRAKKQSTLWKVTTFGSHRLGDLLVCKQHVNMVYAIWPCLLFRFNLLRFRKYLADQF